ncbi:FbpB family small basic protein [Oceanobacillus sp. CF4.6]
MRKHPINMQDQISINKKEILSNKKDMARIEKKIDDKHKMELQSNS